MRSIVVSPVGYSSSQVGHLQRRTSKPTLPYRKRHQGKRIPTAAIYAFVRPACGYKTLPFARTAARRTAGASRYLPLKMGALRYTGPPAGVGPVHPGDTLRATLEGRELLNFDIR